PAGRADGDEERQAGDGRHSEVVRGRPMSSVASPAGAWTSGRSRLRRRQALEGYLCILPWLVGFICFTAGPMLGSLAMSFTDWEIISPLQWVGPGNFQHLLADPLFYQALANTAYISFLAVPLQLGLALLVALGLNQRLRGVNFYRTVFFLPSQ